MSHPNTNKPALNVKSTLAALTVILVTIIVIVHQYFPETFVTRIPNDLRILGGDQLHHAKENLQISSSQCLEKVHQGVEDHTASQPNVIPNIVHFVYLVDPQAEKPGFEFLFRQFVAIYSAWYHLSPDTIYIHTNVEDDSIQGLLENSTNPYTKAISKLPNVQFRHEYTKTKTTTGYEITKLPNQSDFVRTTVLLKYGGIYLDADAYILRDLKPLRYVGFENIVGRQDNGQLCPAVMLATPDNDLIKAYGELQDGVFYPGNWARHATDLLTRMIFDFMVGRQVLILEKDAFFPLKWLMEELEIIYQIHYDDNDSGDEGDDIDRSSKKDTDDSSGQSERNITAYVQNFNMDKPKTWKWDWRLSYVLHGWSSGIGMNMEEEDREKMFGKFERITLAYVMARSSNFARAVYPAVKHAVDTGVLKGINGTVV